jgi:hypothetical protein
MYNTQNYVLGFWTLFIPSILKTRECKISETGSVSILGWWGEKPILRALQVSSD